MTEGDEQDHADGPLVDGVVANEGVVDPTTETVKGTTGEPDGGDSESSAEQVEELAELDLTRPEEP